MIEKDELSIKERLKSKISWKSVLKNLMAIILAIIAFILINLGRINREYLSTAFIIGIFLMCIASSLILSESKEEKKIQQTLSLLKCSKCDIKIYKDYEDGDYVYKKSGKCIKCGSDLIITQIHSVNLKLKSGIKKNKK